MRLLLLLPLGLFADVINLKCDYYSYLDVKTQVEEELEGYFTLAIDTRRKRVSVDEIPSQAYQESGNNIFFKAHRSVGVVQILEIYEVDRLSGEAETLFYTWVIEDSNVENPEVELLNSDNYILANLNRAQCKPVKPLF